MERPIAAVDLNRQSCAVESHEGSRPLNDLPATGLPEGQDQSERDAASNEKAPKDAPKPRHAYATPAVRSRLSPGPGLKTRVVPIDVNDHARLLAATARSLVGLLFVIVALHFLPIHMITPIMTGMGVLMVVTGSYAAWQVGRREPRLMGIARVIVWGTPILTIGALVATTIFGAGMFSPAMRDLIGA